MNSFKKNIGQRLLVALMALALFATILPVKTVSAATQTQATKVTINNAIKVMNVGSNYTLTSKISPKTATSKVTYTSSNKKVATVTKDGVIKAKKSGWVTVTAKTSNGKKDQCKILVVSKYGYTSLQSRVDLMLKADNIKYITINNPDKEAKYKIELGTYKDKTLAVNAPKSDINNHATFKKIKLVDIKNGTWNEFGKGNNFVITDDEFSLHVKRGASVGTISINSTTNATMTVDGKIEKLILSGSNSSINLVVNNSIGAIELTEKVNLVISGKASEVQVVVKAGAEGTTIEAANADALQIDNQSKGDIHLNGEVVKSSEDQTGDSEEGSKLPTGGTGGTPGGSTGGTTSITEELKGVYENGNTTFTVPEGITIDSVTDLSATVTRNTTSIVHKFSESELTQIKEIYTMHKAYSDKWADQAWAGTTKQNENSTAIVTVGELVGNVRQVTVTIKESNKTYQGTANVTTSNASGQFVVTATIDSANIFHKGTVKFTIDTVARTFTVERYNLSDNVTLEVTYIK